MISLTEAFTMQAAACRALGSVLTAKVCESLSRVVAADSSPIGRELRDGPGDPTYHGDSVPPQLCGSLHGLVPADRAASLAEPHAQGDNGMDEVISDIFQHDDKWILEQLKYARHTNEVARSAVLIAAAGHLAQLMPDVRLNLLKLGNSAGLNLNFTHYNIVKEKNNDIASSGVFLSTEWRLVMPELVHSKIETARRASEPA